MDALSLLQKRPGIHMLDLDAERTADKAPRGAPIDLVPDGRSPGVFPRDST